MDGSSTVQAHATKGACGKPYGHHLEMEPARLHASAALHAGGEGTLAAAAAMRSMHATQHAHHRFRLVSTCG